MTSNLRTIAEARFAALVRRDGTATVTRDQEQNATRDKTARLRALRLNAEAEKISEQRRQLELRRREKASV